MRLSLIISHILFLIAGFIGYLFYSEIYQNPKPDTHEQIAILLTFSNWLDAYVNEFDTYPKTSTELYDSIDIGSSIVKIGLDEVYDFTYIYQPTLLLKENMATASYLPT